MLFYQKPKDKTKDYQKKKPKRQDQKKKEREEDVVAYAYIYICVCVCVCVSMFMECQLHIHGMLTPYCIVSRGRAMFRAMVIVISFFVFDNSIVTTNEEGDSNLGTLR